MADNEHTRRLLQGMAKSISAKGYEATTIADIVAEAAVSRRTFYEHFATKADCMMALYTSANHEALAVLKNHVKPNLPWRDQVHGAFIAYFEWTATNPVLSRALLIDIYAMGDAGLKVRRGIQEAIAQYITQTVDGARAQASPLTYDLSVALAGGIHELLLQQHEEGKPFNVAELAKNSADFVCRVFSESDA